MRYNTHYLFIVALLIKKRRQPPQGKDRCFKKTECNYFILNFRGNLPLRHLYTIYLYRFDKLVIAFDHMFSHIH